MRLALGAVILTVVAGCSADEGDQSATTQCSTTADRICELACLCAPGDTCAVREGGVVSTFTSQTQCLAVYAGVGCGSGKLDASACSNALNGVACGSDALTLPSTCSVSGGGAPTDDAGSPQDTGAADVSAGSDSSADTLVSPDVPNDTPSPDVSVGQDVPPVGGCCSPGQDPGCAVNPDCAGCVCQFVPPCCDLFWSEECVLMARSYCAEVCECAPNPPCGNATEVGCCDGNRTVHCSPELGRVDLDCTEAFDPGLTCGWVEGIGYACDTNPASQDPSGTWPRDCR